MASCYGPLRAKYEKMLEQFKKTGEEALAELQKITDLAALEDFRIKYLGR